MPKPTGCTCGYSHSTPSGLGLRGHISHRLHLWLFTFNPFGVGTLIRYQLSSVIIRKNDVNFFSANINKTRSCGASFGLERLIKANPLYGNGFQTKLSRTSKSLVSQQVAVFLAKNTWQRHTHALARALLDDMRSKFPLVAHISLACLDTHRFIY